MARICVTTSLSGCGWAILKWWASILSKVRCPGSYVHLTRPCLLRSHHPSTIALETKLQQTNFKEPASPGCLSCSTTQSSFRDSTISSCTWETTLLFPLQSDVDESLLLCYELLVASIYETDSFSKRTEIFLGFFWASMMNADTILISHSSHLIVLFVCLFCWGQIIVFLTLSLIFITRKPTNTAE